MLKRKRIVVTGMGVLSSIGSSTSEFKENLFARKCGIKPSEAYRKYYEHAIASEITQPVEFPGLDAETQAVLDKAALWAYKVGRDALIDADLLDSPIKNSTSVFVGVSAAGTEAYMPLIENRPEDYSPDQVRVSGPYFSSGASVSALLQLKGGYEVISTACTASTNAIGFAFDQMQNGKSKTALVVGTEPIYLPTFAGFFALKAMREEPCSPFSGTPGMSIGEGAGALVLEEYEHAKARGAKIYGEVIGYATSGDAHHETAPDPRAEGATSVMRKALANSELEPDDIQYINAHGTGTEANDRSETIAMKKVFPNIKDIPISSTKAYVGHNIGSAGIIEFIACLLTLPEGKVLPTLNFTEPRIGCDLNYVPNEFQDHEVKVFLKNNYAFGGNNCCVVTALKPETTPQTSYRPRRVAITGVGIVTSLGCETAEVIERIRAGDVASNVVSVQPDGFMDAERLGTEKVEEFLRDFMASRPELERDEEGAILLRTHEVDVGDPKKYVKNYDARKANRISTFALIALEQALRSSDRKIRRDGGDYALLMGMSKGPQETIQKYVNSLSPDPRKARTFEFSSALMNGISTFCSITKKIKGYNTTLSTGYNAGFSTLTYGYELVRQGLQPQALVGGADENFYGNSLLLGTGSEEISLSLKADAYQVYGKDNPGHTLGEGAGVALIEDLDAARERGANILAEIVGYGRSGNADYLPVPGVTTDTSESGMAIAIQQALEEAGLGSDEIDLVCGTSWGDPAIADKELEGVRQVFGARDEKVPMVNYNGHFGFVEASAAILNIAVLLDCMQRGEIAPIPHTQQFCADDIAFVREATQKNVNNVLIIGLTDGGNNYAVVLRRESSGA